MLDLLPCLRPETLIALAADLEEALEEWQFYPEDAPPAKIQRAAANLLAGAQKIGGARAAAAGPDFAKQVTRLRDARDRADDDDWQSGRNAQAGENWLSDYR